MSRQEQGTFDPRNYKQTDPNWARRRRSDVYGPGVITYTREVKEGLKPNEMTYGAPTQNTGYTRNQDHFQQKRNTGNTGQLTEEQLQDEREHYQDAREQFQDMREKFMDNQEKAFEQPRYLSEQPRFDDYKQIPIQQGGGGDRRGSGAPPVEIKIQRAPKDCWPRKMKSDLTNIYY